MWSFVLIGEGVVLMLGIVVLGRYWEGVGELNERVYGMDVEETSEFCMGVTMGSIPI
jgi:hypothetical protein